jgi:predicted Zn-dependent protease with MMP-like domain
MERVEWSVKNAYLHELGHHFDLGEYELKERGL